MFQLFGVFIKKISLLWDTLYLKGLSRTLEICSGDQDRYAFRESNGNLDTVPIFSYGNSLINLLRWIIKFYGISLTN